MPTIPLPGMPRAPGIPQPVLQPGKQIRIDPSSAFAAQRSAAMQPLMPAGMFQNGEGARAWGQTLVELGKVGHEIAQKEAEAQSEIELEDARSIMEASYADHSNWQLENSAKPGSWRPQWQKTWDGAIKKIESKQYSPRTQQRLAPLMQRYGERYSISVDGAATGQTFKTAGSALQGRLLESIDTQDKANFDDTLGRLASGGHLMADDVARYRLQFRDTGRQKASEEAKNLYSTAVLSGDEDALESSLAIGKDKAGWTDSDVNLMRIKGKQDLADVREKTLNEAERDTLGEVAYRMASGESVLPSQIDGMVNEGKISKRAAASFMEASKRASHPLTGEWGEFIDKVSTYDPDDDPKSANAASLLSEMISKNPDQAQMAQFNAVFEKAQKDNADSGKKVETYALVAGRNQIREAFSKTGVRRAWNKDLEDALQDPTKLEAFGIPKEKADEIKALMQGTAKSKIKINDKDVTPDYAAAFREFKQASVARKAKSDSSLTPWEYNLFEQAATSDADGSVIDQIRGRDAAFDQSALLRQFETWHQGETVKNKGVPPDDATVKRKLGEMVNGALQGTAGRSSAPQSTSANNRITSFGYASDEWADSASAIGIGAFVPDEEAAKIRKGEPSDFKLKENDFAVSPDVETKLRKAGVSPGDMVKIKLADGTVVSGRWMDRTANDQQASALGLPPLRGRWDLYSPSGKSIKDGVSVIGFETPK